MLIKATVKPHPDKPATKGKKQSILALEWQELVLSLSPTDTKKDLCANLITELITVTGIL